MLKHLQQIRASPPYAWDGREALEAGEKSRFRKSPDVEEEEKADGDEVGSLRRER
jgi:hypothetical protein